MTNALPLAGITELLGLPFDGPDIDYLSWSTLGWVIGFNVVSIGLSLWIARVVACRLPVDYFRDDQSDAEDDRSTMPQPSRIVRNLGGAAVLLLGVVFLLTPGQGFLMILLGVVMLDVPGKRRFELALARKEKVLASLNWIRQRNDVPPLLPPAAERR